MSGEVRTTSATGGKKGVKPEQLTHAPASALMWLGRLYGAGAAKYGDSSNFRKGYEWSKSYDAMMRHALAWSAGEDFDPETGVPHTVNIAWHALALTSNMAEHPDYDDRQPPMDAESFRVLFGRDMCARRIHDGPEPDGPEPAEPEPAEPEPAEPEADEPEPAGPEPAEPEPAEPEPAEPEPAEEKGEGWLALDDIKVCDAICLDGVHYLGSAHGRYFWVDEIEHDADGIGGTMYMGLTDVGIPDHWWFEENAWRRYTLGGGGCHDV